MNRGSHPVRPFRGLISGQMNPLPTLPSGDLAQGTLGPPCLTSTTPHPPLANILYLAVLLLTGVCGTQ